MKHATTAEAQSASPFFNRAKTLPSLFLLILLVGFPQISETIYTPSLPDIAKAMATTDEMVQFTLSIYFIGFALGVSVWGALSDRAGRRIAIMSGLVVYLFACVGCYFSNSIQSILIFRFIQAFGASTGSVVGMTLIRDVYTGVQRNKAFSSLGAALALSPALGPMIGGVVDQFFGWRSTFVVLVVMGIGLLLTTGLNLAETRPASLQPLSGRSFIRLVFQLFQDKRVYSCSLLIGACNGLIFSYYAEAPFVFIDMIHLTPGQYGFLGLGVAAATLSSSLLSRKLNSSFQPESLINYGIFTLFLGVLLLFISCHSGLIDPTHLLRTIGILMLPIMVMFVGIGIIIPNTLSIALAKYQSQAGTAASIFGLMYYALISAFTALMGVLHDGTVLAMPNYFLFMGALMLPIGIFRSYFLN